MKNAIGLFILLALGVLAYFLIFNQGDINTNEELKEFAIKDTASIDQFFISQPNGKQVLISRRNSDIWIVNNKYPARTDAVELILITLHDIEVKSPVSKETFEWVVKRLASGSTKVEFYDGGKNPKKTWYIGDASPGRTGTYMLLEEDGKKSSKPFVTHLIAERGYLSSRFFLDPTLWKSREMMKVNPQEIKSIEVTHRYDTATSFRIDKNSADEFLMTNLKTNEEFKMPAELAIPYFKNFSAVFYEYIDLKTSKQELDSIYSSFPRHEIEIIMADGKKIEMKTFDIPIVLNSTYLGKEISYHPERMYAFTSELGKEIHPIVQNLTFDPLVPQFEDFISSTTVEK